MRNDTVTIGNREIKLLYIASAVITVLGVVLLVWFVFHSSYRSTVSLVDESFVPDESSVVCEPRVLDGRCVDLEEQEYELYAVMIENHRDARPQSGLARASVVYEAPVEANFSRFMALYTSQQDVPKIGPVRSARSYFLDWVSEYGTPLYAHVGGSPAALAALKSSRYFDFNEFYRGSYFWRSTDRYAPHNVYTSTELLKKGFEEYGTTSTLFVSSTWLYGSVPVCDDACVITITISFSPPVYEAVWVYSSSTEKYTRFQMGKPHADQDGTVITADTIVVQQVESRVLDEVGRLDITTVGEGGAHVFTKGRLVTGTWVKNSRESKTRFYDMDGKEIPFTPGTIWIEVVNGRGTVAWE